MSEFPGSFYKRNGRWWWSYRLPGDRQAKGRPMKPDGAIYATKDRAVAVECARILLSKIDRGDPGGRTIADLAGVYTKHAEIYYRRADGSPTSEVREIARVLKRFCGSCGWIAAADFGPLDLKKYREQLIDRKLCRRTINQEIGRLKRFFKWSASEQLVSATVYQAVATVEGLKRNRSDAFDHPARKPAAGADIDIVCKFTTPVVAAMIRVQLLTGMRPGEVVIIRPCDIDRTSAKDVWIYRPRQHKTQHHGFSREVAIGPKAQIILAAFLLRPAGDYCFSPAESISSRGISVGDHVGRRYKSGSYCQAVKYAVRAAQKAGTDVKSFSPHQLRHTAAAAIRRDMGLLTEAAVLGQKDVETAKIYAGLDRSKAIDAARRLG